MIKTIYSKTFFKWVLDRSALTAQEASDLQLVQGGKGFYGAGTELEEAANRLAAAGVDVRWQADGHPRIYCNGGLI